MHEQRRFLGTYGSLANGAHYRIGHRNGGNGTEGEFLACMLGISCKLAPFTLKGEWWFIFFPQKQENTTFFTTILYNLYTFRSYCIRGENVTTEVLSVRVKKSLKDEAEKLGVDLKKAVEQLLEDLVAEKKAKAKQRAKELRELMDVKPEEWINDVRATRHEM